MLLIDYSPILISCAHSATAWENQNKDMADTPDATIEEVHFFRMINTLRMINVAYRGKYGKPIICVDRKPYWRSEVFPYYKKNRKPMDRTMDWDLFFANGELILDASQNVFGWKVIDIPGMEGDDIIGTLVHEHPDESHMIVSPDGDFKQLQIFPYVSQYDTIRKKAIKEKHPKKWLKEKIIIGDKKDGIPNIVSPENIFVTEGGRQSQIKRGDKESWINADPRFFCDGQMMARYEMNEKLLDMSMVPDDLKQEIMRQYWEPDKPAGNIYKFFAERGISRFIEQLEDFK